MSLLLAGSGMKQRGLKLALTAALGLVLTGHATLLRAAELAIPDRAHYVFQKVGEDVGMSTITPQSMMQDRRGFIWIATQSGLLRYDGATCCVSVRTRVYRALMCSR